MLIIFTHVCLSKFFLAPLSSKKERNQRNTRVPSRGYKLTDGITDFEDTFSLRQWLDTHLNISSVWKSMSEELLRDARARN